MVSNHKSLTLDMFNDAAFVNDEFSVEKMTELVNAEVTAFDITAKLVNPCGPGGGNPEYELTGEVNALRKYLEERYCANMGLDGDVEVSMEAEFHLARAR